MSVRSLSGHVVLTAIERPCSADAVPPGLPLANERDEGRGPHNPTLKRGALIYRRCYEGFLVKGGFGNSAGNPDLHRMLLFDRAARRQIS